MIKLIYKDCIEKWGATKTATIIGVSISVAGITAAILTNILPDEIKTV